MPKNLKVIDVLPKNKAVIDILPKMSKIGEEMNRVYTQPLGAGMYMGIPPHTYPTAIDVITPFSP